MANRLDLHEKLLEVMGSDAVYYNPPETLKMKYPCIRYKLAYIEKLPANDTAYLQLKSYELTYITDDPDDERVDIIGSLPMIRFNRAYVYDGLYCYTYTIYY